MALSNNDLLVIQQHNTGLLNKVRVETIFASNNDWKRDDANQLITPKIDGDVVAITAADGTQKITLNADGSITAAGALSYGLTGYIADGDLGTLLDGSSNSTFGTVIGTKPGSTYSVKRDLVISLNKANAPGKEVVRIKGDGSTTFGNNIDISFPGTNSDPAGARYLNFNNEDSTLVANQPMGGITWTGNDSNNPGAQNAAIVAYCSGNTGLASSIAFKTQETEKARLTSGGDFLVGGTLPSAPNISLNANGSATFDRNINTGDWDGTGGSGVGSQLSSGGALYARQAAGSSSSNALFGGYNGTNRVAFISATGSATFDGPVSAGSANTSTTTTTGVTCNSSGYVLAQRAAGSTSFVWRGYQGTDITSSILADGSATFAGSLDAASIDCGTY